MDSDQGSQTTLFRQWMDLQEKDLSELLEALTLNNPDADHDHSDELRQLVGRVINHFEDYAEQRSSLARRDVSPYFAPMWCTSLETSMLWAGGCRPSTFIRLVYALSGDEVISRLEENLTGITRNGGLGALSANQIRDINSLQMNTIRKEDQITKTLAGLQEDASDHPLAIIAREQLVHGEPSRAADEALHGIDTSMADLLEESDKLRIHTLKELMRILTPIQGVDFLAASKKLHLCLHAWGKRRDREHGRF